MEKFKFSLCSSLAFILFGLIPAAAQQHLTDTDQKHNAWLQKQGKEFGTAIEREYRSLSNGKSQRQYDLTAVCERFFLREMPLSDSLILIQAAGSKTGFLSAHNLQLPADSADKNDVIAGFFIDRSLISSALFQLIIRPMEEGGVKKINKIMSCRVSENNL